jgi:hypothetical protein
MTQSFMTREWRRAFASVVASGSLTIALAACGGQTSQGPGIEIIEATYGGNCGAKAGNATAKLVGACGSRASCEYRVRVDELGDPAVGCAKDFVVVYRCQRNLEPKRVTLQGEAGLGSVATLTCP